MAKQTISIGTTSNDHTGDPLRTAFTKVNANFTELYTSSAAAYTPTTPANWSSPAPITISEAIDRLAAAFKAANTTGA